MKTHAHVIPRLHLWAKKWNKCCINSSFMLI